MGQSVSGHLADGGFVHHGQQRGGRSTNVRADNDGCRVHEVGNLCFDSAELQPFGLHHACVGTDHPHAGAVEDQFAGEAGQHRPGRLALRLQPRRHVGIVQVAHLPGEPELTRSRVREGNVVQIPLDPDQQIVDLTFEHRIAHVVAHVGGDTQGKIAVNPRAVRAAERALEINHTRKARRSGPIAGAPAARKLALRIGIGKPDTQLAHFDAVALDLPLRIRGQRLNGNQRVLESAGKEQGPARDHQPPFAAGLIHVDLERGPLHTRPVADG